MRSVAAVALVFLCAPPVAGQRNLVANPGFEALSENGDALAAWGLPSLDGVAFAIDDEARRSGERSAKVTGLDPEAQTQYVQAWRLVVGPLPEEPLWLSVWVKAEDLTAGRVNVLHRSAEGEVLLNQPIGDFAGTFDWREIAGQLEPVDGAVSLQLVMGLVKSTGTVWFDDVAVEPLGDPGVRFGRFAMDPVAPGVAGTDAPVTMAFALGESGLETGGTLAPRWELWRPAREFRMRDFVVTCGVAGARFEVAIPERKTSWPPTPKPNPCIITLADGGPLPPGTEVRLTATLSYTAYTNVHCPLRGVIAAAPGGAERLLGGEVDVGATGGPAAQLACIAEARPIAGEAGRVIVAAMDEHGNPAQGFRGTVRLSCNTEAELPADYTFSADDTGSHEFAVRFPAGQVSRVTVSSGDMTATSNPVLPRAADEPGIYFGDIHVHCEVSSDAVGEPDAAYDYARRFHGLDFAALSDHSPTGARWERDVEATNRANDPGRFSTLLAFEWSDGVKGHRNVYYRDDEAPAKPAEVRHNTADWWAYFDERGISALTVPHHPNTDSGVRLANGDLVWGPVDWSEINHVYQRIVEICQVRGSFEAPGGPIPELRIKAQDRGSSVQAALALGHHLGFIGSTDTHSGRPGTGDARCVILAPRNERPALWDALFDRRCYATTGPHVLVFFTLNDQPMGSEVALGQRNSPRRIEWRAIGTGPIARVDLLRNNEVDQSYEGAGRDDIRGAFEMSDALTATEWWYLRVVQEDAHIAWSSPIWVSPE